MFDERPSLIDDSLKQHIETEIRNDEKDELGLEVAQKILGLRSIDKEYRALMDRAAAEQFTFSPERASKGLRPYQTETIDKLKEYINSGCRTVAVQLPTGAGKTFLIHAFLHSEYLKKAKNILVVTPSWEIAHQHAMTLCQYFKDGEKRVRRLGGRGQLISLFDEYAPGEKGKLVITTSALFYARQNSLKEKLNVSAAIIDEGHHGWKKKRLNSVQAFAREIQIPMILLTATPPQNMDGLPFAAQLSYLDLVPEYLVECEVVRLETGEEFAPVLKNGTLSQTSRVEISSRARRFEKIVRDSIAHLKGQTIYYAGSVAEAMGVVKEFEKQGMTAVVVHSQWATKGDRINALAIEKFREGDAQVLVNVQMLAMGFDVPSVETIIVARPVESDTLFTQMVGRGARPSEGKDKFILIDVHDTISKPEVAKIFEHKHLFYAGNASVEEVVTPEPAPAMELEGEFDGLPWREGKRRIVSMDPRAHHFFRIQELIDSVQKVFTQLPDAFVV